jgi:hypothetical protein
MVQVMMQKILLTLKSAILAIAAPSWSLIEKTKQCWRFHFNPMIKYQDEAGFLLGTFYLISPAKVLFTKE